MGFPSRDLVLRAGGQIKKKKEFDPFRDVERAQDLTREGVIASGELLRPEILGRIGDTLGGLNAIGALRSGGTRVALGEINREFTDRFGLIASRATLGAIDSGLSAGRLRLQNQELRDKRRSALLGAIGSVVGAGIGFAVGGPPGAVAGAKLGGSVSGGGGRQSLTDRDIFAGQRVGGQF